MGKYNDELIKSMKRLEKDIKYININNKIFGNKWLNYIVEIYNSFYLLFKLSKEDKILFTDPKAIKASIAFILHNEKYVIVHHLDKHPTYYKIIPFFNFEKFFRRFDKIIAISKFSKIQVEQLGIHSNMVKMVYSGVDHNLFKPTSKKIERFGERYLLHIGVEITRKNIKNLLESFSLLKKDFVDLKLIKLGGSGSSGNRKKTLYYIKKLNLENSIIFVDEYIKEEDLTKYYSNAELFLFPSLLEGFGFPIVEAMACGCPVITSDRNPMKELVGDTQILVDPTNPKEIAQKCKLVMESKDLRQKMIDQGIKRARLFNWDRTARKIYKIISN